MSPSEPFFLAGHTNVSKSCIRFPLGLFALFPPYRDSLIAKMTFLVIVATDAAVVVVRARHYTPTMPM